MPKPGKPASLTTLLGKAERAVYVIDAKGRFAFGNAALSELLGMHAEELVGLPCRYLAEPDPDPRQALVDALAPAPMLDSTTVGNVALPGRVGGSEGGDRRGFRVQFHHLGDEMQTPTAVLAVVLGPAGTPPREEKSPPPGETLRDPIALDSLIRRIHRVEQARFPLARWQGMSAAARRLREQIKIAAYAAAPVLICGAVGETRRRLALTVHYLSAKRQLSAGRSRGGAEQSPAEAALRPTLLPLSAAFLDAERLQSAVTGFLQRLGGELTGDVLVTGIEELSESAQTELLGLMDLPGLSLRVLATTEANDSAALAGLKPDLLERLRTLVIDIPPLAARCEDIPLFAQDILQRYAAERLAERDRGRMPEDEAEAPRQWAGFAAAAMDRLIRYRWPGDVPELEEAIAAACERSRGPVIQPEDLPSTLTHAEEAARHPPPEIEIAPLKETLERVEAKLIAEALAATGGNKAEAARRLEVSRGHLVRRCEQLAEPIAEFT